VTNIPERPARETLGVVEPATPHPGDTNFRLDSSAEQSVNREDMSTDLSNPAPAAASPVDPFAAAFTPKKAISYLRVSTRDQATRGGRDEGFSIPAQREANKKKARELGAIVVREYADKGESGRSIAGRPELKRMLAYLAENDIDYVIVHKLDRLARNRADDVDITRAIQDAGVRLVSTTESIDETPGGVLLHGIMSSIAEFYSRNLAGEVVKGMTEKAKTGGTPGRVPVGYRNIRTFDEGGERRYVELDPDRAPLIRQAFELYATGDWTTGTLADHLEALGLMTIPTAKYPARAIPKKQLYGILTNPYYRGVVTFQGIEYAGTHEPLVDPETWLQVQAVLTSKRSGEQVRVHNHFLKSTIVCGRCGSRMVVQMTTARSGEIYAYFYCNGRKHDPTSCQLRSVLIHEVERRITAIYQRITLTAEQRREIEAMMLDEIGRTQRDSIEHRKAVTAQEAQLRREQDQLLQAHYAGAIPLDLLRREQDRITRGLASVSRELEQLSTDAAITKAHLEAALDLLEDCASTYRDAPAHIKKLMNQAFFQKVLINPETGADTGGTAVQAVEQLNPYLSHVLGAQARHAATKGHTYEEPPEAGRLSDQGNSDEPIPANIAHVTGFRPVTLVELRGFEPLTFSLRTRR